MLSVWILFLFGCIFASTHHADGQCTHGDIRLEDGKDIFEGRVEVCMYGVWGTVCHDRWSTKDAMVVCRQLGLSTKAPKAMRKSPYGGGSGPIHLDNVVCSGSEYSLIDCMFNNQHNCEHSEDAGVQCNNSTPPGVRNITAIPFDTSVLIQWCQPLRYTQELPTNLHFIVACNSGDSNTVHSTNTTADHIEVDGLLPSTSYRCCVTAKYFNYSQNSAYKYSETNCVSTHTESLDLETESAPATIIILGSIIGVQFVMIILLGVVVTYLYFRQRQRIAKESSTDYPGKLTTMTPIRREYASQYSGLGPNYETLTEATSISTRFSVEPMRNEGTMGSYVTENSNQPTITPDEVREGQRVERKGDSNEEVLSITSVCGEEQEQAKEIREERDGESDYSHLKH